MKKLVSLLLIVSCVFGLTGCQLNKPTFVDFSDYIDSFMIVRDYILANMPEHDVTAPSSKYLLTVQLNEDILTISDSKPKDESALLSAVAKLNDKGFSFVNVEKDYMIFWEDETRYYGVLWSANPKSAINRINIPYMKSRKLETEWYEVGALDAI